MYKKASQAQHRIRTKTGGRKANLMKPSNRKGRPSTKLHKKYDAIAHENLLKQWMTYLHDCELTGVAPQQIPDSIRDEIEKRRKQ